LRAGLLSEPEVIKLVNEKFVTTTIAYADLVVLEKKGDEFAQEVSANFSNPVTVMFLSKSGRFISKLTVLRDLTDIHPDTTFRPGQNLSQSRSSQNAHVFLEHVNKFFGEGS